ncbi:MerR family transcriptional regulator [Nocardia sp. NPDC059180]|uniref:MerR family transcriptional regulator n=1 Tax=Nocardia sp. NPDC059180 TaxID=3346761 RepID=UPI0036AE39B8
MARTLGVPVATLRSWIQRYDLGPERRLPGQHRHFGRSDAAVLSRMADLVRAGVSPVDAARAARSAADPVPVLGEVAPVLAAAERLDATELLVLVSAHFAHFGVVTTWNRMCRPAFADVVAGQRRGRGLIDVEHVLTWAITAALHRTVPVVRNTKGLPPVLLACIPGEGHVLPLEALRAALAETAISALLLGAAVPYDALADAVAKQPRRPIVLLWSHTGPAGPLPDFDEVRSPALLLLGGPGWTGPIGLAHARKVRTLEEAVDTIAGTVQASATVGGGRRSSGFTGYEDYR